MDTFVLVQVLGVITLAFAVIAMQQRKKENFILLYMAAMLMCILQYILTGRITGAVIFVISIIRGLAFYYYKKKALRPSVAVLLGFQVAILISTYFTWQDVMSVIPLIATTTNTWGIWQDDMKWTRRTSLLAQVCWMIYNATGAMYTAALTNGLEIGSVLVAMWRYDRKRGEDIR